MRELLLDPAERQRSLATVSGPTPVAGHATRASAIRRIAQCASLASSDSEARYSFLSGPEETLTATIEARRASALDALLLVAREAVARGPRSVARRAARVSARSS
jgi:hypothetical protein